MEFFDDSDDAYLYSLTENLSSSYVDTNKLIYMSSDDLNHYPIGMENFRAKKKLLNPINNNTFPKNTNSPNSSSTESLAKMRWKAAANKVKLMRDPWSEFELDKYTTETAIRHRYNAIKKQWIKDECTVKIENKQFDKGAMRACFRLKKLSNSVHKDSWQHASNYVAKCYMDKEIPRERYFEDVKLQMEAKLWAEIFNRHNPPKKIDMFQVSVIEFKNRDGSPLYHLEHFIDGNYTKYNSNSGFVDDSNLRFTPQAFSHFTFECSNHDLMVVDIQGVGDLYTDPQIHTAKGDDYGDGNLGVKGFALFFSSHVCNVVCKSLGLSEFDLAPSEIKKYEKVKTCWQRSISTRSRGSEEMVIGSPSNYGEYFKSRTRYRSENSMCSCDDSNSAELPDIDESEGYESSSPSPLLSPQIYNGGNQTVPMLIPGRDVHVHNHSHYNHHHFNSHPIPIASPSPRNQFVRQPRIRAESSCLDSAFSLDEAAIYFNKVDAKKIFKPRPSAVYAECSNLLNQNQIMTFGDYDEEDDDDDDDRQGNHMKKDALSADEEDSTLGKVHLELCKYHEVGRFLENENQEFDAEAAFFHLKQAAELNVKDALVNLAKIYLQLPRDILPSYSVEENDENLALGFEYMCKSADKHCKAAMFYVAKAYDTGVGLSKNRFLNWNIACDYYKKILQIIEEESSSDDAGYSEISTDCDPCYIILARMAEMNLNGGIGFPKNPSEASSLYTEAADKAMQYGKGRIANKYYQLAEEASAFCDD